MEDLRSMRVPVLIITDDRRRRQANEADSGRYIYPSYVRSMQMCRIYVIEFIALLRTVTNTLHRHALRRYNHCLIQHIG